MNQQRTRVATTGRHTCVDSVDSGRAPRSGRAELLCVWGVDPITHRAKIVRWVRADLD